MKGAYEMKQYQAPRADLLFCGEADLLTDFLRVSAESKDNALTLDYVSFL